MMHKSFKTVHIKIKKKLRYFWIAALAKLINIYPLIICDLRKRINVTNKKVTYTKTYLLKTKYLRLQYKNKLIKINRMNDDQQKPFKVDINQDLFNLQIFFVNVYLFCISFSLCIGWFLLTFVATSTTKEIL